MIRARSSVFTLLAIVLTPLCASVAAGEGFATPPPRVIESLQREHSTNRWLVVTTVSARQELRVEAIDDVGLHGLRARRGEAPSAPVPWSAIERIEKRESRHRLGQVLGATAGGVALGLAAAIEATSSEVPAGWAGFALGAVGGGWLGGRVGDAFARMTPVYVAPTDAGPASGMPPAAAKLSEDAGKSVLRVRGSFGEFKGLVATIDDAGLAGLAPDPRFELGGGLPPEPLRWDEIAQVERYDVATRRYAWTGGVIGAAVLATVGGAAAASSVGLSSGGSTSDVVGGVLVGACLGGALGGITGGLIGSNVKNWEPVYVAPPLADRSRP